MIDTGLNQAAVAKCALDLVTAMASNPSNQLEPNQETAEKIAEFVETLVDKLHSPD